MTFNTFISLASTVIVTIATVILAGLTARYVRLTGAMAEAMRAAQNPSVVVTLEIVRHLAQLKIHNVGQSPALGISFRLLQDVKWLGRGKDRSGLGHLSVIQKGISYLAPNQALAFVAGIAHPKSADLEENHVLEIAYSYRSSSGQKFEGSMIMDFQELRDLSLDALVDPVEKLADTMRDIESRRRFRENPLGAGMFLQPCPFCTESISKKAKKCPHCLEFIEKSTANPGAAQDG